MLNFHTETCSCLARHENYFYVKIMSVRNEIVSALRRKEFCSLHNVYERDLFQVKATQPAFTCSKRGEICSKLRIKTPYFTACSSVSIVNFEEAIAGWESHF